MIYGFCGTDTFRDQKFFKKKINKILNKIGVQDQRFLKRNSYKQLQESFNTENETKCILN